MYFQWKREWTAPTVVGVIAFGIGAGAGYAFSKYQSKLSRKVSDAIDEMGSDISHLQMKMEENGTRILEAAWDIIRTVHDDESSESNLIEFQPGVDPPEGQTSNIWLGDAIDHEWDMDKENADRVGKEIYILHRDEFDDEEFHYNHTTLTYYAGDDILVDELDVPIHNYTSIIGEGNLLWGKGCGDPSIVYIRNTRIESEMEVILDHGFYQVEVLGQEIEDMLNNEKPVLPKFRDE